MIFYQIKNPKYLQLNSNHFFSKTFLKFDWSSYFGPPNIEQTKPEYNEHNSYSTTSNNIWIINIWIINTNFILTSTSRGNGGAVAYHSSSSSKLLIEYSSFHGCNCTNYGGAIYFGEFGQCVISYACGYKCSTGNNFNGQFSYYSLFMNVKVFTHR